MAPFSAFSPRCILNVWAFLRKNCRLLSFTLRCFIITPRCIITTTSLFQNVWAFLGKNCRLLSFTPQCFIITPRCINTTTRLSLNWWAFLGNNCRTFLFTLRCILFSPRCFLEKWATYDSFCLTGRIF